ncbi:MAG: purine-nucleoside phosphorylase [Planctomycetes bacterium]|nr:purine-nucleoside phosphorylase [Planctomycetota bacterium]
MPRRITEFAVLQALVRERSPRIAMILGSGLGDLADRLDEVVELPFGSIAGLMSPSVPGHRGVLLLGNWAGVPVLAFAGRLHFYEGHPWRTVVHPVHVAHHLEASVLITTNAAGGIRDDLEPGDLMAIRAHLDCTRERWWREGAPGVVSTFHSPRLLEMVQLPTGVYAQLTGPSYETPAEIRALRACGADAVGMSTAREIQAGFGLGMECAAISCITNKAAGMGGGPISHQDVIDAGRHLRSKLLVHLDSLIRAIARDDGSIRP